MLKIIMRNVKILIVLNNLQNLHYWLTANYDHKT